MAKAYFSGDPNLAACPPEEFVRAVSRAATAGFALDGKLAYCVPYGGKSSKWSLQLDYKAIVAVARRSKIILDCEAEIVHKNDDFSHGRKDGVSFLNHTWPLGADRGPVIGAWARVTLPDGRWRYDLMDLAELDYIASLSPMGPDKGPWKKHRGEMQKKTVIRRLLKMYTDDPQFAAVLNAEEYPEEPEETPTPTRNDSYTMPNGRHSLRRDASAAMEYVDPPPPENNDRAAAEAAHQAAETADRQPGEDKDD
jgi:phage RecT family recombinase